MSLTILPPKGDLFRLSLWIFLVAWLIGNFALIAGFKAAKGFLENAVGLCVFAVACSGWWVAYRLSNYWSGGFVVIALWLLGPLFSLLDLYDSVRNPFFWGSTVMLFFLVGLALSAKPRPQSAGEARSK